MHLKNGGKASANAPVKTGQKTIVLASLFATWVLCYMDRVGMSVAIIPLSHALSLDSIQSGYLLSAFYVSYAAIQVSGGAWADRFGGRIVVISSVAAMACFTTATGFACSFVTLIVVRFCVGICQGCYSPASSVILAENFPRSERGRAKSLLMSADFMGAATGSGLMAALIALYDWHSAFYLLGAIGVMLTGVLWFTLPHHRFAKVNIQCALTPSITSPLSSPDPEPEQERIGARTKEISFRALLCMPTAWKLIGFWFFLRIFWAGMQSWMPAYILQVRGISLLHMGAVTVIPFALCFLWTNILGLFVDKWLDGREKGLMVLGAALAALFCWLTIHSTCMMTMLLYWTCCMLAFSTACVPLFLIPLKLFPEPLVGRTSAVFNVGGQIGGILSPVVMGYIIAFADGDFVPAFIFLVVSAIAAVATIATWKRPVFA